MVEKNSIEGLVNPDYRLRMRAIHSIVEQEQRDAVPLLISLLKDREMPVRCAAIVALGTFADPQTFEPLVTCLNAPSSPEHRNAVQALVNLNNPHNRDAFLQALKTESNTPVLAKIIQAVSAFVDEEVVSALIGFLIDKDEDVRGTAAVALGKMRQHSAIAALEHMALTDTNAETSIHQLAYINSYVAKRAIQMILHPEQNTDIDWPD